MNFDRLAPHYNWMEALTAGTKLQRVRVAWLEELKGCRRILSVGEGHGRFAAACSARFPDAELTCVETSSRMLAIAQRRAGVLAPAIRWNCVDVLEWQPPSKKFDAIVTCFFLDCFPPTALRAVIAKLAACSARDACWLVADFAVPARGLTRYRARAIHALMYAFFRATTSLPTRFLTSPDEFLRAEGFQLVARRESEWGLLRADLWQRE